MRNVTVVV